MIINLYHPGHPSKILFAHKELACRKTRKVILAPGFGDALIALRVAFDQSMLVSSCCRSEEHNRTMTPKGHPRSLHVYDKSPRGPGTKAIDIRTPNIIYARKLVEIAFQKGWSVGVSKHFVHLDRRDFVNLPQGLFGYG